VVVLAEELADCVGDALDVALDDELDDCVDDAEAEYKGHAEGDNVIIAVVEDDDETINDDVSLNTVDVDVAHAELLDLFIKLVLADTETKAVDNTELEADAHDKAELEDDALAIAELLTVDK
jgi:hypothetical protein